MLEAVDVLKGLGSNEPFSFTGDHYSIRDLEEHPFPVSPVVLQSLSEVAARVLTAAPNGRHSGAQCLSTRGVGGV